MRSTPSTHRKRTGRNLAAVLLTLAVSSLATGAERKLGRHADCPASYDEATYDALVAWRSKVAKERSFPAYCVFTDATLMAIAETAPADTDGLLAIPGVGRSKLEQYGQAVLDILAG